MTRRGPARAATSVALAALLAGCSNATPPSAPADVAIERACPEPVPRASTAPVASTAVTMDLSGKGAPPVSPGLPGALDAPIIRTLTVSIDAAGEMTVDGRVIRDDATFLALAKKAVGGEPDIRAVVGADQASRYGAVIRAVDLLKQAGIQKIAFSVRAAKP